MKNLLLTFLLVVSTNTFAVEITIDPTLPDQRTMTISCTFALERTDGSTLPVGGITTASFYVDSGDGNGFVDTEADSPTCKQVFDMTQVPDGVYIYAVTNSEAGLYESAYADEKVIATVKRLPNWSQPTSVGVTLGK